MAGEKGWMKKYQEHPELLEELKKVDPSAYESLVNRIKAIPRRKEKYAKAKESALAVLRSKGLI
jgi:hypothetical protein